MSQICFIITDTEHRVYYACDNAERIFNNTLGNIKDQIWFKNLSNQSKLSKDLLLHDLKQQGFFNGFVNFSDSNTMYFCDYGKRYDVDGKHIGFDMVLTSTKSDTAEYVSNLYQGLIDKVSQNPSTPIEQIYEQEKSSIEQNVGTEFSEFLLAILDEHED